MDRIERGWLWSVPRDMVPPASHVVQGAPREMELRVRHLQVALERGLFFWQALSGSELSTWRSGRVLPVRCGGRVDGYDGRSLRLSEGVLLRGNLGRVVTHAQAHALLDAVRGDLWSAPYREAEAVHEAFADTVTILSTLYYREDWRGAGGQRLLDELLAELPPGSAAGRALTAAVLAALSSVMGRGAQTGERLRGAALALGTVLVRAVQLAPLVPAMVASVAQAMLDEDAIAFACRNVAPLRAAFTARGIPVGAPRCVVPVPFDGGPLPWRSARVRLRTLLGAADGARLDRAQATASFGHLTHVLAHEAVDLSGVDARLAGVSALVPATMRVMHEGDCFASQLGDPIPVTDQARGEARAFAAALLERGALAPGGTHAALERAGRRVIARRRTR